jgi:hypothetical protein
MPKLRYCSLCKRNVEAVKGFNWLVFIFLLGIPYVLFWMVFKRRRCPVCGGKSHLASAR